MMGPSILFPPAHTDARETPEAPASFSDLNLDQIVDAVTMGKAQYNLKPLFYTPLKTADAILYRQEVMQDLEHAPFFEKMLAFAARMMTVRSHLEEMKKLYYPLQKQRWFLDAVDVYLDAVAGIERDLSAADASSRGIRDVQSWLAGYVTSDRFRTLRQRTDKLKADLGQVSYCFLVKGNGVRVRRYDSEIDYSADVLGTFEKFQQGGAGDYLIKFHEYDSMNHVEASILEQVAKLYPEIFADLDDYCSANADYLDETVLRLDREVQFYVSYLEFISRHRKEGLPFCYPRLSTASKEVLVKEGFDLALANRLAGSGAPVVCNDFHLRGSERIIVVSGPNQGGKTTFSRAFGQLHYLGVLGFPVPGREATIHLFDELYTHFERQERIDNLRGKLADDLARIHEILHRASPDSIVIMNEIFNSTTVADAVFLGRKVMERMIERDLLCVCVTFLDELASLGEKTVSMVSTVVPENPAVRTFKIIRRPADGLSYAIWIAEKYRLTYPLLKERVPS
jgi:DNA mismatch repair protein MutS